jgi:hypothetical protein
VSELVVIPLARIRPNLNQVRRTFHRIDELARSIAQYSLLQNLVVRPLPEGGYYEIVAGERRYRALALLAKDGRLEPAAVRCFVISGDGATGPTRIYRERRARRRSGLGSRAHLPQLSRVRPHTGRNRRARRQDAGVNQENQESTGCSHPQGSPCNCRTPPCPGSHTRACTGAPAAIPPSSGATIHQGDAQAISTSAAINSLRSP